MISTSAKQLRSRIKRNFIRHFRRLDYEVVVNGSIIPRDDATVLFCGATISAVKGVIRDREATPGRWVIAQRCLRLHDIGALKRDVPRHYLSYFEMVSLLSTQSTYDQFLQDVLKYVLPLIRQHGLELEIWTRTTNKGSQSELLAAELTYPLTLVFDKRQKYEWTYGEDGLSGLGCLLHVRGRNGDSHEFGQIIQILRNGAVIGYEFGFGVETFSGLLLGKSGPYASFPTNEVFNLPDEQTNRIYLDHLTAALAILAEGIRPGKGRRQSTLRAIINTLHREFFRETNRIDSFDEKVRQVSLDYFGTSSPADQLITILLEKKKLAVEAASRMDDYIRNQHNLVRLGLIDQARARKNIDVYKSRLSGGVATFA